MSDQMWARRRGVTQIPTFLVCYRGEIVERWSGYNGNWREVLQRIGLDDYVNEDGSIGPRKPAPAQPPPEQPRQPAPTVNLQPINDRLGNLEGLIRNLSQSREIPQKEASPFADPESPKQQPTPQPTAAAKQEVEPGGLASDWGAVLGTVAKVGLAVAAPEIALPAGALSVASVLYRAWRSKRGATTPEPRQVVRQQTVREVPVVVATDTPPQPARVVETNHFVPIEKDTHAKAWAWASVQYAKKYPGSENMVAALDHLMGQYRDGQAGD
jgi:hypothetical protein